MPSPTSCPASVEYNYYDFGTREIGFTPQIAGLGRIRRYQGTKSVVRAGLNLRFGGYAAPVAAKY